MGKGQRGPRPPPWSGTVDTLQNEQLTFPQCQHLSGWRGTGSYVTPHRPDTGMGTLLEDPREVAWWGAGSHLTVLVS